MKEHEFKIRHDKTTGEWRVWVKAPLFFHWFHYWQIVYKEQNFFYGDPIFISERDAMEGIDKWKRENTKDEERYITTQIKR